MGEQRIERGGSDYPAILQDRLGDAAPPFIHVLGDAAILRNRLLGLVCSIQCPGSIVIQTFDAMRVLRDAGVVVVGGFHSPMESECLDLLLRGPQSTIMCPAKSLRGLRLGQEARRAVKDGRLLVLSPFGDESKRTTSAQAAFRNDMVAALADAVLIPHAAPGGKTEATAMHVLSRGQRLFTFDDEANSHLLRAGAERYELARVLAELAAMIAR